ncbi:MAG: threonylcarbamoyl-AMP synthase [Burkholderiales bacterium]|nr:threonylcarbamoyl-AMP synthase [Burkholderiales bacterium]
MKTEVAAATPEAIAKAARMLRAGGLVAFPTETVYGLGADAGNPAAVRAIFAAKRRPADHPVIVHLADAAGVAYWAREVPPDAQRLAEALWPGPLTLILPRSLHATDEVTGGQDSVGLRVPSHRVAQALLRAFAGDGGRGVAAPSANRFGHISPTTAQHVADDLRGDVDLVLDGGACDVGIESTIVAFTQGEPVLLRPGGVPVTEIARVLGRAPRVPDADAPRASGTLASHYAPRTPALLAHDLAAALADHPGAAVLARTLRGPTGPRWINAPDDPVRYAHDLYANLRALDASGAAELLIETVPDDAAWFAVRDRLLRATHLDPDDRD